MSIDCCVMFRKSRFFFLILKISLMIKIYKNLDFRVNFRKCSVQFFGIIDIGQNFRKILFLAKI